MALKLGIETYQILTNDDEVCIPSLSSILLAVRVSKEERLNCLKANARLVYGVFRPHQSWRVII
jgi:hypothetical protein